jgi:hypothetical protein
MIGVNDTSTEVFRPADATKVAAFAEQKNLAWTSMWSAARDKPCQNSASPTCSGIDQDADAFAKAFTGLTTARKPAGRRSAAVPRVSPCPAR